MHDEGNRWIYQFDKKNLLNSNNEKSNCSREFFANGKKKKI